MKEIRLLVQIVVLFYGAAASMWMELTGVDNKVTMSLWYPPSINRQS